MEQRHIDYQRARQAVLDAQQAVKDTPAGETPEARERALTGLSEAHERLRQAEGPVKAELARAWDANVAAVAAAKAAVNEARRAETVVQRECADAARDRNPARPVLNTDEFARCGEAALATAATLAALEEAGRRFKAGVTVEQLEAVT